MIIDAPKDILKAALEGRIEQLKEDSIHTEKKRQKGSKGLFNRLKVEDIRDFDAVSKKAMEDRAIENGILDKAFKNAKIIIEKLVNNEVVKELGYTIVFEMIEE